MTVRIWGKEIREEAGGIKEEQKRRKKDAKGSIAGCGIGDSLP